MKQIQKTIISALALLAFVCSGVALAEEKKVYNFYGIKEDLDVFNATMEGHDKFDIENWVNLDLDRHSLEMLIFSVAPILGGCECEINILPHSIYTPHGRSLDEVKAAHAVAHHVTIFTGDSRLDDSVMLSKSILEPEDFYVGLYTHDGRKDVLNTKPEDINKLVFVAGRGWDRDIAMLEAMKVAHVKADTWHSALDHLLVGHADVIMQPFRATSDMGFLSQETGEKYIPIPGVKIPFFQGRAYFVSKNHPDGIEFYNALNRGLEILDGSDNFLRQAHIWVGVINPETDDYEILFEDLDFET